MNHPALSAAVRQSIEQGTQKAVQLMQEGRHEEADRLFRDLLNQGIGYPTLLHFSGLNAIELGRGEEGIALLKQSIALLPGDFAFKSNMATALIRLEKWDEAEALLRELRTRNPSHAPTAFALATLLHRSGHDGEAIEHWKACTLLEPEAVGAWFGYGESLTELHDWSAADEAYARAQALRPDHPLVRTLRADLRVLAGRRAEAKTLFEEALKLKPGFVSARIGLAELDGANGNFDKASSELRSILTDDPDAYAAAWMLARFKKFTADDPDKTLIKKVVQVAEQHPDDPMIQSAWHAWGKVLEDLGDYDAAWESYSRAKSVPQIKRRYTMSGQQLYMELILKSVDRHFIERHRSSTPGPARPIYVLGIPRSGTTLVEQILAAHSQVTAGGEMAELLHVVRQGLGISELEQLPFALNPLSPSAWGRMKEALNALYLRRAEGRANLTDKMPSNFIHVGMLHALSPEARFVHVRRDARDTCVSCYTTLFKTSYKFAQTLTHLGHYYRVHEAIMDYWQSLLPEGTILEVNYEQLARDPETEVPKLLAKLDLPFEEACLRPETVERPIATASLYQVRQPIRPTSIGRWHHFAQHLGPLEEALAIAHPLALPDEPAGGSL
ncbi:TPR domain/sulfotransferase domain protein [mine drainage metagenome]|uniref:TPR domain/sulfotransferase domain protein n=2 Tax=mine drainage metagenome TaxID=410659 RepID=T1B0P7_9ZZZZ